MKGTGRRQDIQTGQQESQRAGLASGGAPTFSSGTRMNETVNTYTANVVGAVSNFTSKGVQSIINKKQAANKLKGEAAAISGIAFEDLDFKGNKHALNGYKVMSANRTAAELRSNLLTDLKNGDYELDTDDYTTMLSDTYEAAIDGLHPDVAAMVHDQYVKGLPEIITQHTSLNADYKLGLNKTELSNSIIQELSNESLKPEDINDTMTTLNTASEALSKDDKNRVLTGAVIKSLVDGDVTVYDNFTKTEEYKNLPSEMKVQIRGTFQNQQQRALSNLSYEGKEAIKAIEDRRANLSLDQYSKQDFYDDLREELKNNELLLRGSIAGSAYEAVKLRENTTEAEAKYNYNNDRLKGNTLGMATYLTSVGIVPDGMTQEQATNALKAMFDGETNLNITGDMDTDESAEVIMAALYGIEAANDWISGGKNKTDERYVSATEMFNINTGTKGITSDKRVTLLVADIEAKETIRQNASDLEYTQKKTTYDLQLRNGQITTKEYEALIATAAHGDFVTNSSAKLEVAVDTVAAHKQVVLDDTYAQRISKSLATANSLIRDYKNRQDDRTNKNIILSEDVLLGESKALRDDVRATLIGSGVPSHLININQLDGRVAERVDIAEISRSRTEARLKTAVNDYDLKGETNPEGELLLKDNFNYHRATGDVLVPIKAQGLIPKEIDLSASLQTWFNSTDEQPNEAVVNDVLDYVKILNDPKYTHLANDLYKTTVGKVQIADIVGRIPRDQRGSLTPEQVRDAFQDARKEQTRSNFDLSRIDTVSEKEAMKAATKSAKVATLDINRGVPYQRAGATDLINNVRRTVTYALGIHDFSAWFGGQGNRTHKQENIIKKAVGDDTSDIYALINTSVPLRIADELKLNPGMSKGQVEALSVELVRDHTVIIGEQAVTSNVYGPSIAEVAYGANASKVTNPDIFNKGVLDVIGEYANQPPEGNPWSILKDRSTKPAAWIPGGRTVDSPFDISTQERRTKGLRKMTYSITADGKGLQVYSAPAVEDPETLVEWTEYVGTIPLKVIGDHAFNKYVREQGDK